MVAFEATSRPPFLLLDWRFLLYKLKKKILTAPIVKDYY